MHGSLSPHVDWDGRAHRNGIIKVQSLGMHLGALGWTERSSEQALGECQLYHMLSPLCNSSNFAVVCKWSTLRLFA